MADQPDDLTYDIVAKDSATPTMQKIVDVVEQLNEAQKEANKTSTEAVSANDLLGGALGKANEAMEKLVESKRQADEEAKKAIEKTKEEGKTFEELGKRITEFVKNPMETAKKAAFELLETMGPTAVAWGAMAVAAAAAGAAVWALGVKAAEAMESLENTSMMTGLTTQKLQGLKQIAAEAGLGSMDLGRMLGMLQKQMAAEGSRGFSKILKEYSISTVDAQGNTKDMVAVLDALRSKLLAIEDPQKRVAASQEALGGRMRYLIPIVLNVNESLEEGIEKMKRWGVITDEETKKAILAFDAFLDTVGTAIQGATNQLEALIGATLGKFTAGLTELAKFNKQAQIDRMSPADREKYRKQELAAKQAEERAQAIVTMRQAEMEAADDMAAGKSRGTSRAERALEELQKTYKQVKEAYLKSGSTTTWENLKNIAEDIKALTQAVKDETEAEEKRLKLVKAQLEVDKQKKLYAAQLKFDEALKYGRFDEASGIARQMDQLRIAKDTPYNNLQLQKDLATIEEARKKSIESYAESVERITASFKERATIGEQIHIELDKGEKGIQMPIVNPVLTPDMKDKVNKDWEKYKDEYEKNYKEMIAKQKKDYEDMIDQVRDSAGQVFDAILTGGKNAFMQLADWLRATFMTQLRTMFQNFMQQILTGSAPNGGLLGGTLLRGLTSGGVNAASSASSGGGLLGGLFGGGSGGGAGLQAGLSSGGEGLTAAGGSTGMAALAGPAIIAAGAIIGISKLVKLATRGARRRQDEIDRRILMQEWMAVTMPSAVALEEGVGGETGMTRNVLGQMRGYKGAIFGERSIIVNLIDGRQAAEAANRLATAVTERLLKGGSADADNVAWAATAP